MTDEEIYYKLKTGDFPTLLVEYNSNSANIIVKGLIIFTTTNGSRDSREIAIHSFLSGLYVAQVFYN